MTAARGARGGSDPSNACVPGRRDVGDRRQPHDRCLRHHVARSPYSGDAVDVRRRGGGSLSAPIFFQVIGARSLGEVGYAPISALWTIQYLIVSVVLYPVETYVTHRTLLGHAGEEAPGRSLARIWVWIAAYRRRLDGRLLDAAKRAVRGVGGLALVVGLVTAAYGAFMIVRGRLAGTERFKAYGLVTASESIGRAVLASGVVWIAATTRALAWVMPVGAFGAACLWLTVRRRPREPRAVTAAAAPPRPVRFLALTTSANGILQLLLAGGPLVLVFLGAPPAEVSILFVTLAAARVPLVFFFSGLLSRVLPTFLRLAGQR